MSYSEKLKNPLWQKKRLEILNRDNFTCTFCGDKETELHIHHKEYIRGRQPWEYEDSNFQTACKHCHRIIEILKLSNIQLTKAFKLSGENCFIVFLFLDHESDKRIGIIKIPFDTDDPEFVAGIHTHLISQFYEFTQNTKL